MTELKRNRNLDVATENYEKTVLFQSAAADTEETVQIGIADAGAIYQMLSDLSANKGAYVLREAYSNAYDATVRAGDMSAPIEITIPDAITASSLAYKLGAPVDRVESVVISDHGCGMDADTVRECFLQYGGSDKREEIESIGSKGLGSKAPLALTDSFVVRTTKDGITTTAVVTRDRDSAGEAKLTVENTGEPSGTTVTIPVADPHALEQMHSFADELLSHVLDVNLTVNGKSATRHLPTELGDHACGYVFIGEHNIGTDEAPCLVRIWEPDSRRAHNHESVYETPHNAKTFPVMDRYDEIGIRAMIGGVTYDLRTADERNRHHIYDGTRSVLVALDAGWLDFTPSRDEIRDNQARRDMLKAICNWSCDHDYDEELAAYLAHTSATDVVQFVRCTRPDPGRNPVLKQHGYSTYGTPHTSDTLFVTETEDGIALSRQRMGTLRANIAAETLIAAGIEPHSLTGEIDTSLRLITEDAISADFKSYSLSIAGNKRKKSDATHANFLNTPAPKPHDVALAIAKADMADPDRILVVTGVAEDEELRWLINHTSPLRSALDEVSGNWNVRHVHYLSCATMSDAPAWVASALKDLEVPTISYDEAQAFVKDEFRRRRRKAAESRVRDKNGNVKQLADLMATHYRIPHGFTSEELLAFADTGTKALPEPLRDPMQHARAVNIQEYLNKTDGDAHHVAFVIDPKGRSSSQGWQATLALLAKNTNIFDDSVTDMLFIPTRPRQNQVQTLLECGATCVFDGRTNVKGVAPDQVATRDENLFFVTGGDEPVVHLSLDAVFGDDQALKARWAIMDIQTDETRDAYNLGRLRSKRAEELSQMALVYDILNACGRDDLTRDVDFVFSARAHVSAQFLYMPRDVMWLSPAIANNPDGDHLASFAISLGPDSLHNIVVECGDAIDAKTQRTLDAYLAAISPVTAATGAPNTVLTDDTTVNAIADLLGEKLAYTVAQMLR